MTPLESDPARTGSIATPPTICAGTVRGAPYRAPELRHSTRPGAMDAYKLPSRYLPNPPTLKKGLSE